MLLSTEGAEKVCRPSQLGSDTSYLTSADCWNKVYPADGLQKNSGFRQAGTARALGETEVEAGA